jgi:hypothetical protein
MGLYGHLLSLGSKQYQEQELCRTGRNTRDGTEMTPAAVMSSSGFTFLRNIKLGR